MAKRDWLREFYGSPDSMRASAMAYRNPRYLLEQAPQIQDQAIRSALTLEEEALVWESETTQPSGSGQHRRAGERE
jgi:hypothetical protein